MERLRQGWPERFGSAITPFIEDWGANFEPLFLATPTNAEKVSGTFCDWNLFQITNRSSRKMSPTP